MPLLSLTEIKADLQRGLTRTPKDKHYNPEKGSVQEKYNLTLSQVNLTFKHPELKGLRTRVESEEISFIEEIENSNIEEDPIQIVYEEATSELVGSLSSNTNEGISEEYRDATNQSFISGVDPFSLDN